MACILIVEDDLSVRAMIRMHLSLVGHTVKEASDADETRKILETTDIDLAILDIMLPGEDAFEPAELLARIENILKRTQKEDDILNLSGIFIDFKARRVFAKGEEVTLTALEFDLLSMLARRRNIAVSREELLSSVWGYDYMGETRTVDVHVQRLRSKIGAEFIETVYKFGYRFSGRQA